MRKNLILGLFVLLSLLISVNIISAQDSDTDIDEDGLVPVQDVSIAFVEDWLWDCTVTPNWNAAISKYKSLPLLVPVSGTKRFIIQGPQSYSMSFSAEATHQISASVTASVSSIEAALGISLSYTTSQSATISGSVNANRELRFRLQGWYQIVPVTFFCRHRINYWHTFSGSGKVSIFRGGVRSEISCRNRGTTNPWANCP